MSKQALMTNLGVSPDPIVGNILNTANAGISGATVSMLNLSKTVVATATTDITVFYYFPALRALSPRARDTVKVSIPKGYKSSAPTSPRNLSR